jgi:hypothetical protein
VAPHWAALDLQFSELLSAAVVEYFSTASMYVVHSMKILFEPIFTGERTFDDLLHNHGDEIVAFISNHSVSETLKGRWCESISDNAAACIWAGRFIDIVTRVSKEITLSTAGKGGKSLSLHAEARCHTFARF